MSGFWDWALDMYHRDTVAAACLHLQDAHGQNVPLLLWAAWSRIDDAARLAPAAATAKAWESAAIAPLRQLRRDLKAPVEGVDDTAREALRDRVKGVELEAERGLMAALEAMAAPTGAEPKRGASALQALTAASAAWGRPAAPAALQALSDAVEQGVAQ